MEKPQYALGRSRDADGGDNHVFFIDVYVNVN